MNDTIKVGDRVYRWVDRDAGYVLRATRGPWAWIERDDGTFRTVGLGSLAKLTPIEPEPVALTPKYGVGQEVESPAGKRTICQVFVAYRMRDYVAWWAEGQLEPVPAPCPECKGSGKASEGGA